MTSAILGSLANALDPGAAEAGLTVMEAVDVRLQKMHHYAAAGIPWYLIVEQETQALHLHELVSGHYREHSVTRPGDVLRLTEPVTAIIAPEDLLPGRRS